jgi:hypothetical protein
MVLLEEATMSFYYVIVEIRNHKGGKHFLHKNEMWRSMDLSKGKQIMKCEWVFKSKPKLALLINIKQGL